MFSANLPATSGFCKTLSVARVVNLHLLTKITVKKVQWFFEKNQREQCVFLVDTSKKRALRCEKRQKTAWNNTFRPANKYFLPCQQVPFAWQDNMSWRLTLTILQVKEVCFSGWNHVTCCQSVLYAKFKIAPFFSPKVFAVIFKRVFRVKQRDKTLNYVYFSRADALSRQAVGLSVWHDGNGRNGNWHNDYCRARFSRVFAVMGEVFFNNKAFWWQNVSFSLRFLYLLRWLPTALIFF